MRRFVSAITVLMIPVVAHDASGEPLRGAESPPIATPAPPETTVPPVPGQISPHSDGPVVTPGETAGAVPDATARAAGAATVDTSTSAPGGHAESPSNDSLSTTGAEPLKTPAHPTPALPNTGRQP
jgi:hypothetical protein